MVAAINSSEEQLREIVRLEFGDIDPNDPMLGRYRDLGRDMIAGRVTPDQPAAVEFLAEVVRAAEEREAARVAELHAQRAETAKLWNEFEARRSEASAAPEGKRFVSFRDERTGALHKLALPEEFFVD